MVLCCFGAPRSEEKIEKENLGFGGAFDSSKKIEKETTAEVENVVKDDGKIPGSGAASPAATKHVEPENASEKNSNEDVSEKNDQSAPQDLRKEDDEKTPTAPDEKSTGEPEAEVEQEEKPAADIEGHFVEEEQSADEIVEVENIVITENNLVQSLIQEGNGINCGFGMPQLVMPDLHFGMQAFSPRANPPANQFGIQMQSLNFEPKQFFSDIPQLQANGSAKMPSFRPQLGSFNMGPVANLQAVMSTAMIASPAEAFIASPGAAQVIQNRTPVQMEEQFAAAVVEEELENHLEVVGEDVVETEEQQE